MKIPPDSANCLIYLKLDVVATSRTLVSLIRNCLKKYNTKEKLYCSVRFTKANLYVFC